MGLFCMQSFVNKKKMQALQIANCLLQTIYALVVQKRGVAGTAARKYTVVQVSR